jgi:hypothetical protein
MNQEELWTGCECGCACCGPSDEYNNLVVSEYAGMLAATTPAAPGEIPLPGDVVYDSATDKLGVVMDWLAGLLYLRPPGGGREWVTHDRLVRRRPRPQP